ncbi:MAG: cupin domain-containing protein [Actinomycetota bacterium]|nr:cupin domain-containing protein [Actinomycetota bacterium]
MTTPIPTADDAVVVRSADAETLGHPAFLTVRLLTDATATEHALSAVRVTLAEGVDGATPHHHTGSAELFYVLDGELQVLLGDQVVTAGQGDLVVVPHHLAHAFGAAPGHTADLLIVIAPGIDRFEYFRTLERIAYGTESPDALHEQQERYDNWFLESPAWQTARATATS